MAGYGEGLGGTKRKFRATTKLGVYFSAKTCEEMNKQQKLEARIAEGKCEEGHREGQEHLRREAQGEARA